eukprot:2817480-Rhodomonas_salina.2
MEQHLPISSDELRLAPGPVWTTWTRRPGVRGLRVLRAGVQRLKRVRLRHCRATGTVPRSRRVPV